MTRQRVVKFGSTAMLGGVLTEPPAGVTRQAVGVIILNSGILHHVGANRLHVQLARHFAEAGFTSLRFDFSGIGDSEARRDHLSFEESSPIETRDAIDYLNRTQGTQGVVLVGLCSGADAAHLTAMRDERVVGLGLLDPWVYPTRGYFARYYGSRLVDPRAYLTWVAVRWARLRDRVVAMKPDAEMYEVPEYVREFPPREIVASDLRKFVSRGVELHVLFSGGLYQYNHLGQYRAAFPDVEFNDRLHEVFVPGSTHVFSAVAHQTIVVNELGTWMRTRFGRNAGRKADAARRASA